MAKLTGLNGSAAAGADEGVSALKGLSAADRQELLSLSVDILQLGLDLAGIADPTPISDGTSALISLCRGQWFDAALSGISMIPYIGDLAKAGKLPKYLRSVEKAIHLAEKSTEAAKALLPGMRRLEELLNTIPANVDDRIDRLRVMVSGFVKRYGGSVAQRVGRNLPDIRRRFRFPPLYERTIRGKTYLVKEASGRLGVPGQIRVHRSPYRQGTVSAGSGDDAGHLIGNQFGAPGGTENLSRQNWVSNQGGGSWHDLEDRWSEKLQSGVGIEVTVRDFIPADTVKRGLPERHFRPTFRTAEWREIYPDGTIMHHKMSYMNTHTADAPHRMGSRTQQDIQPTVPPGNRAEVYDIRTGERID